MEKIGHTNRIAKYVFCDLGDEIDDMFFCRGKMDLVFKPKMSFRACGMQENSLTDFTPIHRGNEQKARIFCVGQNAQF